MEWYHWFSALVILGGVAWLCTVLYGEKGGPTHCIGCGKCTADGKCILQQKRIEKKRESA